MLQIIQTILNKNNNTVKHIKLFEQFVNEALKVKESTYPKDVVTTSGNIMTTREGNKFKVMTVKPKPGSEDFYYDTIMNRIDQLEPEDWDVDVNTYKKAVPVK